MKSSVVITYIVVTVNFISFINLKYILEHEKQHVKIYFLAVLKDRICSYIIK